MLTHLARIIASTPADEPLPVRLCRACVEVLGADGGAVTLASTTSERLTLSTSNGVSAQIEDLQDVLGEGPGEDAYRLGRVVVTVVDGFEDGAFPMFSDLAGKLTGPLTVWAIPMHPGGTTIGVVTVYRRTGELAVGLDDAQFLSNTIGAALLDDPSAHGLAPLSGWNERARVHQATGMVIAQLRVGADDALAMLRAHAFAGNTTLDAVADDILERRLDFARPDSGVSSAHHPTDDRTEGGDV